MGFKKVGGARRYIKYSECNEGDVLISNGSYLGSEEGRYGVQHLFQEAGGITVLNSAGQLNYLVDKHLTPGYRCNINYGGKVTLTSGPMEGKESHQFEMEVDDGTPDVATAPQLAPTVQAVKAKPTPAAVAKAETAKPRGRMKKVDAPAVQTGEDIEL